MTIVKVGVINYLNTYPVYYGFEKGLLKIPRNTVIVKGVPTVLNKLLENGEIDISVISSFEYAKNYKNLLILPNLSVGANKKVMSVLFLTRKPIEKLGGSKIYLTNASLTSKMLLLIYLKKLGVKPKIEEFEYSKELPKEEHDGVLVIGDDALILSHKNSYSHAYDLAEIWYSMTKLPFVFALWCVNEKSLIEKRDDTANVIELIYKSKEIGKKNYRKIASEKSKELGIPYKKCMEYLKTLHFDLDNKYLEGLKLFLKLAKEEGIINEEPSLRFYNSENRR
ncbi:MAG: menaquinone biosynthetic enzyme MqnA/MqnD family protein [Thermosulfidibacteraceae bacterium]